ncbi:osmotically-inducible lipoprotein B [Roseateles sp.]|uniref:osmotically-inducible lipoprotein B n=1 Tax=Roseateles sp. TaxID=1971397 RepID=UPI00286B5C4C|nr:osmotically-inducible lipoprotein B [Roseateles sp.]
MISIQRFSSLAVSAALLLALGACAGMSQRDKNMVVGAGIGAAGGAVLTGGAAAATVGGAVVGGVIGHELDKDKKK